MSEEIMGGMPLVAMFDYASVPFEWKYKCESLALAIRMRCADKGKWYPEEVLVTKAGYTYLGALFEDFQDDADTRCMDGIIQWGGTTYNITVLCKDERKKKQ